MKKHIAVVVGIVGLLVPGGAAFGTCAGDCGRDGTVTVNELIVGVNMALGAAGAGQCAAFDSSGDGKVTVNELVAAVSSLLNGCPFTGQYTAHLDVGDGKTATVHLQVAPDGTATGSLSVAASGAAAHLGAIRIDIPFVPLTGTVNLDTGAYDLHGTFNGPDGEVPIDVSGTLPERTGASGTLDLDIGNDSFNGNVVSGDGMPTPVPTATRTPAPVTSTPTATTKPIDVPTPGSSCLRGSISAVFSDLSGTNSYLDLNAGLALGKLQARNLPGTFGGEATVCSVSLGDVIQTVRFGILQLSGGPITIGQPYTIGDGLAEPYVAYLEIPSTNPLGARGWKAHGGAIVVDSIDGSGTAHFRIVDAQMLPEPSFSFQQPATGTFTMNAAAVATHVNDP
jgi:hypothetical protein